MTIIHIGDRPQLISLIDSIRRDQKTKSTQVSLQAGLAPGYLTDSLRSGRMSFGSAVKLLEAVRHCVCVVSEDVVEDANLLEFLRMPARRYKMGDRLRKIRGSEWQGRVVGLYSTELTPVGYAIESEAHKGSVQIYPESALELVP